MCVRQSEHLHPPQPHNQMPSCIIRPLRAMQYGGWRLAGGMARVVSGQPGSSHCLLQAIHAACNPTACTLGVANAGATAAALLVGGAGLHLPPQHLDSPFCPTSLKNQASSCLARSGLTRLTLEETKVLRSPSTARATTPSPSEYSCFEPASLRECVVHATDRWRCVKCAAEVVGPPRRPYTLSMFRMLTCLSLTHNIAVYQGLVEFLTLMWRGNAANVWL